MNKTKKEASTEEKCCSPKCESCWNSFKDCFLTALAVIFCWPFLCCRPIGVAK